MSSPSIEFYFDFGSPASYLASTQLPAIAQEAGAALVYRPMLLGGVFKATGNSSPATVPAKGRWMRQDLALWAREYRVPFTFNPHFPVDTLALMRGATGIQARQPDDFVRYIAVVFEALWVHGRNPGDAGTLAALLQDNGFDAARFREMIGDPAVKAALIDQTGQAVARGVFGAPTCFVGDRMFFGQDRLAFIRQALAGVD